MIRWMALIAAALCTAACATSKLGPVPEVRPHRAYATVHADFPVLAARTRNFTLGEPQSIRFVPNSNLVLFLRSGPESFEQDLYAFDRETGEERVLLTADKLLGGGEESLSVEELARRERMRQTARGIASYQLSQDGNYCLVPLSGGLYVYAFDSGSITEVQGIEGYPIAPAFSPDGTRVAVVRDGDLYVAGWQAGKEWRLTTKSHNQETNGLSEFVAQEEMGRLNGFWWSPDSTRIVYQQTDTRPVETLHIADAANPDSPPQAWPYPRAGTANAVVRLGVIAADGGETTWIDWDRDRYPYLVNVCWTDNAPLTIQVQNRTQTAAILYKVAPDTGALTELLVESDSAWINIDQQMPKWLPDGSAFFWTTERNGYWQLELRNADGSLRHEITKPAYGGYESTISYNHEFREMLFYMAHSPLSRTVYSIEFDEDGAPSTPKRWSVVDAMETLIADDDHQTFVRQTVDLTGTTPFIVCNREGAPIGVLRSDAMDSPFAPNVEIAVVGEAPGFFAAITRPHDFDADRKYPVVESVYGGPGPNHVSVSPRSYLHDQWLADHGFIVVRIDARGTPKRGRDWERAIKGDLIDVPLREHVHVLQALALRYPEMDIDRVGIHGWSFGGYFSAMAVMRHPELYKAGIAGAPVVQWEDYDTHYTERYMGLPQENADGYRSANVLTYANQLRRPLLLIHGTTDDNVYFMHSLKLSDTLYRAGIPFEFYPLSNFTHMVADPEVAAQRAYLTLAFFKRHL